MTMATPAITTIISVMIIVLPVPRLRGLWHRECGDQRRQANAGHFGQVAPSKPCVRQMGMLCPPAEISPYVNV
jgi:hypothetical protein